jgi:hypothetical protein
MTPGAVIHFHGFGLAFGGFAQPGNAVSPDIAAVAGEPVFLVDPGLGAFAHVAVTLRAIHARALDVGRVGEKDAVGLPRMAEPGDFPVLIHIFRDVFFLIFADAHGDLVAVDAAAVVGQSGKTAVITKIMAGCAPVIDQVHVNGMIEADGLLFFGIKQFGKDDPSKDETAHETGDKKEADDPWGIVICGGFRFGRRQRGLILSGFSGGVMLIRGAHEISMISAVGGKFKKIKKIYYRPVKKKSTKM